MWGTFQSAHVLAGSQQFGRVSVDMGGGSCPFSSFVDGETETEDKVDELRVPSSRQLVQP